MLIVKLAVKSEKNRSADVERSVSFSLYISQRE